jgi:DNA-binding NarL/FixJ family response regulator
MYRPSVVILDDSILGDVSRHGSHDLLFAHRVLLLAEHLEIDRLLALIDKDVKAILSRSDSGADLIGAIRTVSRGGYFIASEFTALLIELLRSCVLRRPPSSERLTRRQRQVLDLVCQGLANRTIARTLGVSEKTVKFHVSNVLTKTDTRSRAQLIAGTASGIPVRTRPERSI